MALMPTYNSQSRTFLRRTNSRLTISEHDSPAEVLVVDSNLPVAFNDLFGGHANLADGGDVLIGKGRVVSILRGAFNRGKYGPSRLTICNNNTASGVYANQPAVFPVGVSFQNVYKNVDDKFSGNQPAFVNNEYIEVPLVVTNVLADPIKTGVAYGSVDSFFTESWVMSDTLGRIIPWDNGDVRAAIGKVLAVETDVPPQGWMEWVMMGRDRLADQGIKDTNYPTLVPDSYNPVTSGAPYPYNPLYAWPLYDDARGIERLSDGSYFGNVQYTSEAVVDASGTAATVSNVTVGTVYTWYVKNPPISTKDVNGVDRSPIITIVTLGATDITADCVVDYKTGKVTYKVTGGNVPTVNDTVAATYFRGPGIAGIPRNWDEAGTLGAIRILLSL